MLTQVPRFIKSFYFIAGIGLLLWMAFFDANDLWTQYKLTRVKSELIDEKEYFQQKTDEVKKERKELMSNPNLLEKFARERYLMKKPTEDVYIVIDENLEK